MNKLVQGFPLYFHIVLALNLTFGISFCLSQTSTYADGKKSTVNASVTVSEACSMTGTGTLHTAILNPGTYSGASGSEYENGIGKTTLTVVCNDNNGFSIYAVGYTNNSMDTNNTKLIGSNTSGLIETKAYVSGDVASNWSMKVTKVSDSTISYNPTNMSIQNSFDSWHAVPSTYTKVAQYHANTGSSSTDTTLGAKVETTYAAYIATNQPADVYEGQVKYTLVHPYNETPASPQPAVAGKIVYHKNSNLAVGTMANQSAADGNTVTLYPSNFSRTGYGFAGWSDAYDYDTNPNAHFYGPNEDIVAPTGTTANGLSLYAVWVKSVGSMQDRTKVEELCGTTPESGNLPTTPTDGTANFSHVTALTDMRGQQTYAIAKLNNGQCWMLENLRLDDQYTTGETNKSLSHYGTDFIGLASSEDNSLFNNITTANSLYSISGSTDITISGDYQSSRIPRYNNSNTTSRATSTANGQNIYSYGNYYSWAAAAASTENYNSTDTYNSICPKGWNLPLKYNFDGLNYVFNNGATNTNAALRRYPVNFIYSGTLSGQGLPYNRGVGGYYWTSSSASGNGAYTFAIPNKNTVIPGTGTDYKFRGRSVRCFISSGGLT